MSNSTAGNFVSTSESRDVDKGFAGKNGYLYVLRSNRYIDINKTYGDMANYIEKKEFSIIGNVKPSEIVGAYRVEKGVVSKEFIKNPNFRE